MEFPSERPSDDQVDPDFAHFNEVVDRGPHPRFEQTNRALDLIGNGLMAAVRDWEITGPNDFSGIICFTRSFRQLHAATLLAFTGYYSEVGTVLRSANESAALGRYLAHEPKAAEKWLRKSTWIPDREVRNWFGDKDRAYASMYSEMSSEAHPTAASCLPMIHEEPNGYSLVLESKFEDEPFQRAMFKIAGTALWICFALRNAAPAEEVLPPGWRKELKALAEAVAPDESLDHLERDWARAQEDWDRLRERVQSAEALDRTLDESPISWRNLSEHDPS